MDMSWVLPFDAHSPSQAMLSSAAPAGLLVLAAFGLGIAFATRNLIVGTFRDEQVAGRGSTAIVGDWLRQCFAWGMQPVIRGVLWLDLPAAALTILALLTAIGSGAALASGAFTLGGSLFAVSGICDFLDGRIAREKGTAGPSGALLDSVIDRFAEAAVFAGLAWYYRGTWVLAAVLGAMSGSFLVPYVRARGEALGVTFHNVGVVQRPERFVILGSALLISPIVEQVVPRDLASVPHRLVALGLIALAISTGVSVVQRMLHASRALNASGPESKGFAGRGSLVRNAIASAAATAVDFAAVVAMVELASLQPATATLFGCALGAVVNFVVNRFWAFETTRPMLPMAARYAFVSASSAGLNAGLLSLLLMLPTAGYAIIWWVVRGVVYLLWNFPLHRDYVFSRASLPPLADIPSGSVDEDVPPSSLLPVNAARQ